MRGLNFHCDSHIRVNFVRQIRNYICVNSSLAFRDRSLFKCQGGRLKIRSIIHILGDPPLLTKFRSNDPPPPGNHMKYNLTTPPPPILYHNVKMKYFVFIIL